ncbi:type IV pilus modification PilV family protein [Effusibacillus pohliae]|uniref:type IV pilus modification PilV family protein n=1 Tax=Effusibacillus pohliae TaxID=232270 RepID=UPI00036FC4D0|nr:prepilin-type N-terminal cleavage/methylation domain-containing protein [Effusibacillus pohliae]
MLLARTQGKRRKQAGFTLVEALAALALLGIVLIPILTLKSTVLQSDVYSGKRSQAIGLATAMLEFMQPGAGGVASSFILTSTVQGPGGVDQNASISQRIDMPQPGSFTGWQPLYYMSGADTGMSYNISVTDRDAHFTEVKVQVKYKVGMQEKQESLWTIFKK